MVGILAAAQTLVVLTAGIDLSIGVMMVFCFVDHGQHGGQLRDAGDHRR